MNQEGHPLAASASIRLGDHHFLGLTVSENCSHDFEVATDNEIYTLIGLIYYKH